MDIKKIFKKIEETERPKVKNVAVAYSGGLDSSLALELLRRKCKAKKSSPSRSSAFIEQCQKVVNGKYEIKLYKGDIEIAHRESKTSLFSPGMRSIKATGFHQRRCADGAYILEGLLMRF